MRPHAWLFLVPCALAVACGGSDDESSSSAAGGGAGAAGSATAGSGTAGSGTSGSGTSGSGTAGSGTAGSGTAGSGTAGSGTAGSGTAGSGTAGSGTAGSGTAGSGTSGSGTAGSGTAGSGTAGSGTSGSGTAGSGTAGSGTAGSGTGGSGTAGSGTAGNGTAGSGTAGSAGAGGGTSTPPGYVAIAHLSWDWGTLHVCGRKVGETATVDWLTLGSVPSKLVYKDVTTHVPVPSGQWEVDFVPAGMPCAGFTTKATVAIDEGARYTLVAAAVESHIVKLLVDDVPPVPPPNGKAGGAFVRLFHGAPSTSMAYFGLAPDIFVWEGALGDVGQPVTGNTWTVDANRYFILPTGLRGVGASTTLGGNFPFVTTQIQFDNYVQSTVYALGTSTDPVAADPPVVLHCIETNESGPLQSCATHPFGLLQ